MYQQPNTLARGGPWETVAVFRVKTQINVRWSTLQVHRMPQQHHTCHTSYNSIMPYCRRVWLHTLTVIYIDPVDRTFAPGQPVPTKMRHHYRDGDSIAFSRSASTETGFTWQGPHCSSPHLNDPVHRWKVKPPCGNVSRQQHRPRPPHKI